MALRDIKGVRTESMGEEPQRRVQIIPDRAPSQGAGEKAPDKTDA
jgi:hypothetical protein